MNAYQKAVAVLRALGGSPEGKRIRAVASETELPQSTVHSILDSLVEDGWVNTVESRYSLSIHFFADISPALLNVINISLIKPEGD